MRNPTVSAVTPTRRNGARSSSKTVNLWCLIGSKSAASGDGHRSEIEDDKLRNKFPLMVCRNLMKSRRSEHGFIAAVHSLKRRLLAVFRLQRWRGDDCHCLLVLLVSFMADKVAGFVKQWPGSCLGLSNPITTPFFDRNL